MTVAAHSVKGIAPLLLVSVAVVSLALAARQNRVVLLQREDKGINAAQPLENAPPLMVFTTVVLGGFRGVLADVLWLRVSALQDRGRHFEIVQLADWITKLEPRCPAIWAYHAWNMAYNISVVMADPEDRWRWVQNGVKLLRDEGLVYNPADAELYKELGWLFQHKIGAPVDPSYRYYTWRWAQTVQDVLESGHPDYQALSPATRTRLRDTLKLDADTMRAIDAEYGPLDWRLPQAHALYWAYRGVRDGKGNRKLSCRRMIYQAMSALVDAGHLRLDAGVGAYETSPAPELVPQAMKAYEDARVHHDEKSVRDAYMNFLWRTARSRHAEGEEALARSLYGYFCERFPREATSVTYEQFVLGKDKQ